MSQTCYLFAREQLLKAVEAHAATFDDPQAADRMRSAVLGFLDSPAANAEGLTFIPSKIGVEDA